MKRRLSKPIGLCCYLAGVICAAYYGIWKMLCIPVHTLIVAGFSGQLTLALVMACGVKILFSTTLTGFIWCLGYIAYNHFKGDEDPDWDLIMQGRRKQHRQKEEGQTT